MYPAARTKHLVIMIRKLRTVVIAIRKLVSKVQYEIAIYVYYYNMTSFILAGECKSASTAGKRRTVVGPESIFRSALRDQRTEAIAEGNSGAFVLRLDSPLTAITAIAVAICLLIITIFSIIFAVLQVQWDGYIAFLNSTNTYNICCYFLFFAIAAQQ